MRETPMDFESYKNIGIKFKDIGNLRDALIMYEKALQCVQTKVIYISLKEDSLVLFAL